MAGHVPKRVLKLPEVDKILLEGTSLYKWEEVSCTYSHSVCFAGVVLLRNVSVPVWFVCPMSIHANHVGKILAIEEGVKLWSE